MNAIDIQNLKKAFPGFLLDDVSLSLPQGCIMGLIGENGAGKSTLFKLMLNMIAKESGSITILGKDSVSDSHQIKEDVGVVTDEIGLPECLTAKQVGKVMKNTFARWDEGEYDRLLKKMSLPEHKPFKDFSRGMKTKLGIAIALSHHAKLLLLDEPTNGLDPVVRDEVVEMLSEFTRDESHSILISSHIVTDLEKICDYAAFLHKGTLLLCEEKDRLLSEYGTVFCTKEQFSFFDGKPIRCKKETPYGVELLMKRQDVPDAIKVNPISLEELFVFMMKGGS
ncbi:MAG: ABC transporter ATP-binding protein [Ruminococcaceae bacterium]|nr:ABC transporter ATP-binding protein [Oscillospiraceae bacterium]